MKRQKIVGIYEDAAAFDGQVITVCGWARSIRDNKHFGFIALNDGSCFKPLQVVFAREDLENYDEIAHQNVGAALICTGTLVLTPDAQQPFELKAANIFVEGTSTPQLLQVICGALPKGRQMRGTALLGPKHQVLRCVRRTDEDAHRHQ